MAGTITNISQSTGTGKDVVMSQDAVTKLFGITGTGRVLWVQNAGQTLSGQVGSANRPFASLQDAIEAAKTGDTVIVLPGTGAYGPVYCAKSLTFIGLGYPQLAADSQLVFYMLDNGVTQLWRGFTLSGKSYVSKPKAGANNVVLEDCRFLDGANLYAQGTGIDSPATMDIIELRRCRGVSTTGKPFVVFAQRNDFAQAQSVVLDDCVFDTTGTLATGEIATDSRLVLRGTSRLKYNPKIQSCTRVNFSDQLADALVVVDERLVAGGGSSGTGGVTALTAAQITTVLGLTYDADGFATGTTPSFTALGQHIAIPANATNQTDAANYVPVQKADASLVWQKVSIEY